jgi:hypothetical protein
MLALPMTARRRPAQPPVRPVRVAALLAALGLGVGGCAFENVNLTLGPVAQHAALAGGAGRRLVVIVPFENQRGMVRCGMMKNSFNMDTADAVCSQLPEAWIANLLASELRAAGFVVTTQSNVGESFAIGRDVFRVEGDLRTLFVEPIIGFWSVSLETDFEVRLHVSTDSGLEADRAFFVKGIRRNVIGAFSSVFQNSLDEAARQIVREMVSAIVVLMNRYPELGEGLDARPLRLAVSLEARS